MAAAAQQTNDLRSIFTYQLDTPVGHLAVCPVEKGVDAVAIESLQRYSVAFGGGSLMRPDGKHSKIFTAVVTTLQLLPGDRIFLSTLNKTNVIVNQYYTAKENLFPAVIETEPGTHIVWSTLLMDGTILGVTSDGAYNTWDISGSRLVYTKLDHGLSAFTSLLTNDSSFLCTSAGGKLTHITFDGSVLWSTQVEGGVSTATLINNSTVAIGNRAGTVSFWSLETQELCGCMQFTQKVTALAMYQDMLVIGDASNFISFANIESQELIFVIDTTRSIQGLSIFEGGLVVSGSYQLLLLSQKWEGKAAIVPSCESVQAYQAVVQQEEEAGTEGVDEQQGGPAEGVERMDVDADPAEALVDGVGEQHDLGDDPVGPLHGFDTNPVLPG
ncbi:MAG: hypothetical protein S4CHLAM81_01040 [Chlamydiales bacterium]|nr:hypothetical protein [Chlamydiales bacterium]MCH9634900.1 hypothetical protein [Chlamydiales bacterium]MCH9703435.1 WD40 repeat domain-containing protein [Chlamydiota bacterium]